MPFSVREGINIFLAGFVPTENLRFRPVELTFKVLIVLMHRPIAAAVRFTLVYPPRPPSFDRWLKTFKTWWSLTIKRYTTTTNILL